MYKVVELNSDNIIGIIDFNNLDQTGSLETYWNFKLDNKSKRLMTFDWSEAFKVYEQLTEWHPLRSFEIRNF